MSRLKMVVAVCVAAVAISAVAAGSASASGWFVGGTELKAGEEVALASTAKVALVAFNLPFTGVRISCNAGATVLLQIGAAIVARSVWRVAFLIWRYCRTVAPTKGCELQNGTAEIKTLPLVGVLTKGPKSPEDRVTFSPATKGKPFAEISFAEGNTCAFEGIQPLKGQVSMGLPIGQTEAAVQELEAIGSMENNSLELGGSKAYIEGGKALLSLATGANWSFH